jgi:hypothetical protein
MQSRSSRHDRASAYARSGLFKGLGGFADLESRIERLPTEQERGAAFEVFVEAYLNTDEMAQAEEVWVCGKVPAEFVCETFLEALGISTPRQSLVPVQSDPPDVTYFDIAFEVKEVLDSGRARHAEYKTALEKARTAEKPEDLVEPWNLKALPLADSARTVAEKARTEALHYAPSVRRDLDLLYYVNYMDEHPVPGGATFDASVLQPTGWRSVSLLFGQFGWVLFASPSAPKLLRDNEGTPYYRDPKRFGKDS